VQNEEFADELGVNIDGFVSLQEALHYLKKFGLRLFKEGVEVRSTQVKMAPVLIREAKADSISTYLTRSGCRPAPATRAAWPTRRSSGAILLIMNWSPCRR